MDDLVKKFKRVRTGRINNKTTHIIYEVVQRKLSFRIIMAYWIDGALAYGLEMHVDDGLTQDEWLAILMFWYTRMNTVSTIGGE